MRNGIQQRKIPERNSSNRKTQSSKKGVSDMENKKTTARAAKDNAQNDRNNDPSGQLAKALSGAKGAKSDAKKKAKGAASNGTSKPFSAGGKTVFLRMPNETVNTISIENSKIYDHDSRDIIEPARNVRSYSLFGDVYATLDELIKDYAFIPFPYQKENVKILLNNCDGRGVLGDQVGLGKTVEALMATHVMFKSGTIRNALIVAPHKAADGWAEEIEKKFKGIFYFDKNALCHGSTHGRDPFYETLKRIDADNNAKGRFSATSPYRVYIVTDKMLENVVADINLARENAKTIEDFNNTKINAETAEKLQNIERDMLNEEMCGIDNSSLCYKFFDILKEHGYQGRQLDQFGEKFEYNTGIAGILVNCALTRDVCNRMLEILGKLLANYEYINGIRRRNDPGREKRIEDVKNVIEYFESVIDTMKKDTETYERCQSVYSKLFLNGSDRLVDLLIVDEIHSFYNDAEAEERNDDEFSEAQYDENLRNCVRLLARINKKFCILISATPLRTNLQNVFDLVYIADKARLGALLTSNSWYIDEAAETEEFENAKKYFYNVICHTDDDEHSLIKMFFADESLKRIKQDSIRDFFGLIDNFFTRSRIKDVHSMMHGDKRSEKAMRLIESKKSEIIDQRALIYQQADYKPDKAQDEAVKGYDKWKANPDNDRSMNSAIDTVLIKAIKNAERNSKNIDEQRELYSMVDWSRGEKVGIALDVVGMKGMGIDVDSDYEDILNQSAYGIVPCLYALKDILRNQQDALTRVAKYLIWESDSTLAAGVKAEKARRLIYDYENDLCYNTVLCYADKRDDTLRRLGEHFKDGCHSIDHESGGRRVKVSPTISDVIDRTNHNQIAVINQDYQAGVNLQQYKTFVFTQMDWRGERLLEPIDIEQFIGRIHRTGQVKNCRIVTLLSTYMNNRQYNPEVGFLKWYYKVLSDAKGFDLYGNSTPDVAFIQPIVVDGLRWKFGSIVSKLTLNKLIITLQRIRDLNGDDTVDLHSEIVSLNQIKASEVSRIINKFSFPQLLEFAYYYDQEAGNDDLKNSVTDLIYKLCEIEGFGKDHRRVYG